MFQNSKTRYLHISVDEFGQKLWSFRFETYFDFGLKVEAPAFWEGVGPLWAALCQDYTGSERGSLSHSHGKHNFLEPTLRK